MSALSDDLISSLFLGMSGVSSGWVSALSKGYQIRHAVILTLILQDYLFKFHPRFNQILLRSLKDLDSFTIRNTLSLLKVEFTHPELTTEIQTLLRQLGSNGRARQKVPTAPTNVGRYLIHPLTQCSKYGLHGYPNWRCCLCPGDHRELSDFR